MIRIVYGHHRDIDNIRFESGWLGRLYLKTQPKGAEVKYINDVEEKNGIEITKSRISQNVYTARFVASEAKIKVLQKLPLLSDVRVKVDDFEENKVYNFKFDVITWMSGGSYANCEIKYVIETFVNKNTI